jgi:hypothetical protein
MQDASPQDKRELAWLAKPYGESSTYAVYQAVSRYRLDDDLIARITTPLLVTDPEGEQFWPGQSQRLYDALRGDKQLVRFSAAEGADRHCQPMGRALTEQRMFDWLDDRLA